RAVVWLPLERHSRGLGAGLGSSFTHLIPEAGLAGMTGGVEIATIVRRCRDHSRIASVQLLNAAIDVDLVRRGPDPGETHCIYSVHFAPLGVERDLWRCRRGRGRTGLRAVSPAGVHIAKAMKSAPDDHFTVGPHYRVIGSASGCVGSARSRPAIRAGI